MTLTEVKQRAVQDKNGGAWWLNPPGYDQDDYREAWHRIDSVPVQNGVRRPKLDSLCGKAWAIFDSISTNNGSPASISEALKIARQRGLNEGNVRAEFYQWRKFHGIRSRTTVSKLTGPDGKS
jgi:hypothetical protein